MSTGNTISDKIMTLHQEKELRVTPIVALWSVAIFLTFILIAALTLLVAPSFLLIIFPQGKFMSYLFWGLPWMLILLWCIGTIFAFRRHQSWKVVIGMVLTGLVVVSTFPIWFYLAIMLFAGGWNVGK